MKPLSSERLAALTTTRVLAYRRQLLALEDSAAASDLGIQQIARLEPGYIYFKDSSEWADLNDAIGSLLRDRERVDRGPESA